MSKPITLSFRIKLAAVAVVALVGLSGFTGLTRDLAGVTASAFGPSASHTGAPSEANCTECHNSFPVNSGSGRVSISGLPLRYTPGQQVAVTVTTSQSDAIIYGFQAVILDSTGHDAGSVTLPSGQPQRIQAVTGLVGGVVRTYIEHTIDGITPMQFGSNSWTFTWTAPAEDVGPVTIYAAGNAANSDGNTGGDFIYTTAKTMASRPSSPFDFDGDSKTDISIFRSSVGEWWYSRSSDGQVRAGQFGNAADVLTPGDFTGDGKADVAFWRPSDGLWYILRSEDSSFFSFPFGANGDIPMPSDFDGDGKTDAAVFRPSEGLWYILQSSGAGTAIIPFGSAGDKPVSADYDGDGKSDIGIVRDNLTSGNKEWWIQRSNLGLMIINFGVPGDRTVPGDYTGDGKADVAFFRPGSGFWFILRSEDFSFFSFRWGQSGDIPTPGDYDGDGKADAAVFRPATSTWFINRTAGQGPLITDFGQSTDTPVPSCLVR
jgi:hypothetical protein